SSLSFSPSGSAAASASGWLFLFQPFQLTREFEPSSVDSRLDGPFRQAQPVGDFLVRQLLQIPKHDSGAERGRQLAERHPQQLPEILVLRRSVRSARGSRRLQVVRSHTARDRLPLLADAAIVIDAQITANADDPRLKVRPSIERPERLEDLQENVLGQVFGLVVLTDELVRNVEHLPPVLLDDHLPGYLITTEALLDQHVGRARWQGRGRVNRHLASLDAESGGDPGWRRRSSASEVGRNDIRKTFASGRV